MAGICKSERKLAGFGPNGVVLGLMCVRLLVQETASERKNTGHHLCLVQLIPTRRRRSLGLCAVRHCAATSRPLWGLGGPVRLVWHSSARRHATAATQEGGLGASTHCIQHRLPGSNGYYKARAKSGSTGAPTHN